MACYRALVAAVVCFTGRSSQTLSGPTWSYCCCCRLGCWGCCCPCGCCWSLVPSLSLCTSPPHISPHHLAPSTYAPVVLLLLLPTWLLGLLLPLRLLLLPGAIALHLHLHLLIYHRIILHLPLAYHLITLHLQRMFFLRT